MARSIVSSHGRVCHSRLSTFGTGYSVQRAKAMVGAAPHRFRPMYAWANMGHPSHFLGLLLRHRLHGDSMYRPQPCRAPGTVPAGLSMGRRRRHLRIHCPPGLISGRTALWASTWSDKAIPRCDFRSPLGPAEPTFTQRQSPNPLPRRGKDSIAHCRQNGRQGGLA